MFLPAQIPICECRHWVKKPTMLKHPSEVRALSPHTCTCHWQKSCAAPPFVGAIWHCNMLQHLDQVHPQNAHPRNPSGHPLPASVLQSITLTLLKQKGAGISDMYLLTPLFDRDKENQPATLLSSYTRSCEDSFSLSGLGIDSLGWSSTLLSFWTSSDLRILPQA